MGDNHHHNFCYPDNFDVNTNSISAWQQSPAPSLMKSEYGDKVGKLANNTRSNL